MTTLDKYFVLSDFAIESEKYFNDLIDLFEKDAVLKTARGEKIIGIETIRKYHKDFFALNSTLKHVWSTEEHGVSSFLKTYWISCGRRKTGEVFFYKGYDIAEINYDNKIVSLEVIIEKAL